MLELTDMENMVNFCAGEKSKFIRHMTNLLNHLKRAVKFWGKLVATIAFQRCLLVSLKLPKDPITHVEAAIRAILVIQLFHSILGQCQIGFEVAEELITLLECSIDAIDRCGSQEV